MLLLSSNNAKDLVEDIHCLGVVCSLGNKYDNAFVEHSIMG